MKKSSYEGLQKDVRKFKTPEIEVWDNKYSDKDYLVRIETDEFTCICPKTGLPDFAAIKVEYVPDGWCIELKSLKLYFVSYRNIGIFHEHVTNRILDDLVKAAKPRFMRIEMAYKSRGGIKTSTKAEYIRKGYRPNEKY
ncbi:MAG: preQ(1) synthase [Candidatus Omnitrophica bacterium]|nr:preQ(1) synthase [Candidatus Omnitrophota bacterium]MBU4487691.1 preQ(1) synthase [Candidatus Omnitrophota bacterium]MCG2704818.1 preQ(1) synthase [Candidatus Omnitrophota bacterium]